MNNNTFLFSINNQNHNPMNVKNMCRYVIITGMVILSHFLPLHSSSGSTPEKTNLINNILLTVESLQASKGDILEVGISVNTLLSTDKYIAYEFNISYPGDMFSFVEEDLTGSFMPGTATLIVNEVSSGLLRITCMSEQIISGAGTLLTLKFTATQAGKASMVLTNPRFNNRLIPQDNITNGRIDIYPAGIGRKDLLTDHTQGSCIPVSPDVASFFMSVDKPSGLSAGNVPVSLPLWSAGGRDLSHSISLYYHTGGIRIEEVASQVGLGWHLQAGGVITRTVRGLPDDMYMNGTEEKYGFLNGGGENIPSITEDDFSSPNIQQILEEYAGNGKYDGMPDIFYFNAGGVSGRFYLDKDRDVHTTGYQNTKIIPQSDDGYRISGWEIISSNGVRYLFETSDIETSQYSDGCNNAGDYDYQYISSWRLSRIESPVSDDEITFTYTDYTITLPVTEANMLAVRTDMAGATPVTEQCISHTEIHGKKLSQIDYATGRVEFIPGAARADLDSETGQEARLVKELLVKDNNDEIITRFIFDLVYRSPQDKRMSPAGALSFVSANPSGSTGLRPMLEQLIELRGSEAKVYRFEYYGTGIQDVFLPDRISATASTDHWGYFNPNSALMPSPQVDYYNVDGDVLSLGSADKSPDLAYARAGALKQVTNPLGGITQYEYQLNRAFTELVTGTLSNQNTGGLRLYKTIAIDNFSGDQVIRKYEYKSPDANSSGALNDMPEYGNYFMNNGQFWFKSGITTFYPLVGQLQSYSGYSRIVKYEGEFGEKGKTEYTYTWLSDNDKADMTEFVTIEDGNIEPQPDQGQVVTATTWHHTVQQPDDAQILLLPPVSRRWKRGLPETVTYFDEFDQSVKKTTTEYDMFECPQPEGLHMQGLLTCFYDLASTPGQGDFFKSHYYFQKTDNYVLPVRTISRVYNTDDTRYTEKSVEYSYNDLKLLNSAVTKDRDGTELKTMSVLYTGDITSPTGAIADMQARNMNSKTIEKKILKQNMVYSAAYNKYSLWGQENYPLVTEIYAFQTDNPVGELSFAGIDQATGGLTANTMYEKKKEYTYYDDGRAKSSRRQYSIPSSYIWNNNRTLPVATVLNARPEEVFTESFEEGNTAEWTGDVIIYTNPDKKSSPYVSNGYSSLHFTGGNTFSATKAIDVSGIGQRNYIFSAMIRKESSSASNPGIKLTIDGNTTTAEATDNKSGTWAYVETMANVPAGAANITIEITNDMTGSGQTANVYVDDVRFYPVDARLSVFTYDESKGITSVSNANSMTGHYEYADNGRLETVRDDERFIIGTNSFEYKPYIAVTNAWPLFEPGGGEKDINVFTNESWSIDTGTIPSWISLTPESGDQSQIITISCDPNNLSGSRQAGITVNSSGGRNFEIHVTQQGQLQ